MSGNLPTPKHTYAFLYASTKAMHLELVHNTSTADFIAAMRCFMARRGCPTQMWSDNGSNFVGAHHELAELYSELNFGFNAISGYTTSKGIEWKFIPAHAPHFGSLWEAAVKAAKLLICKTIREHRLTDEDYQTILADVEAVLNSCPICRLDSFPDDGLDALTPGHFLVGRLLTALPQPTNHLNINRLRRWNLCQLLVSEFWKSWKQEYLQLLQKRAATTEFPSRWHHPQLFLRTWPLNWVEEIHPGPDGCVHAVTVRTNCGWVTRPIHKLVPLLEEEESDLPLYSAGLRP